MASRSLALLISPWKAWKLRKHKGPVLWLSTHDSRAQKRGPLSWQPCAQWKRPLGSLCREEARGLPGDERSAPVVGAPEVFTRNSLESLSDVLGGCRAGHTHRTLLVEGG